jgi:hypothetical protein
VVSWNIASASTFYFSSAISSYKTFDVCKVQNCLHAAKRRTPLCTYEIDKKLRLLVAICLPHRHKEILYVTSFGVEISILSPAGLAKVTKAKKEET